MIDIFTNGSFNLVSFRTLPFNINANTSKKQIIDDLTLKYDSDDINNFIIDRIYGSWIVFDNDKYNIYKICKYEHNTLYAKIFCSSNKKINNFNNFVHIIKSRDPVTKKKFNNSIYNYTFFYLRYTSKFYSLLRFFYCF